MKIPSTPHPTPKDGYSLISLMVMMSALVSVTSTAFVLTADSEDERRDAITKLRYKEIKESILGPSEKMTLNGSVVEMGFINDMGDVPRGSNLSDLAKQGDLKPWGRVGSNLSPQTQESRDLFSQIAIYDGWRGPYVQSNNASGDPTKDGWGNDFEFATDQKTDNDFDNKLALYSLGSDNQMDVPGVPRGYNDDYPYSNNAKNIPSSDYNSQIKAFPSTVSLPTLELDACNYYVGMIYPGMDLERQISSSLAFAECAPTGSENDPADPTDPIDEPDADLPPYEPVLPCPVLEEDDLGNNGTNIEGGSLIRRSFTLNDGTTVAGGVYLYGMDQAPSLNLNQKVPNGTKLTGDLFVPGSPQFQINGDRSLLNDRFRAYRSSSDLNYQINLNGSIGLNSITYNANFGANPTFLDPESPAGSRWVNLDRPTQSIGDPSTLRGLNVNSGYASDVILPPGAYQSISMSTNSRLVLGNVGDTEPAVYSFDSLNMNNCDVVIVGPTQIRMKHGLNLQRLSGNSERPDWLNVYTNGDVNMNSGSSIYGNIFADGGRVTINNDSTVYGIVVADHLTMNSNSSLLNGYGGPISTNDPNPVHDTPFAREVRGETSDTNNDAEEETETGLSQEALDQIRDFEAGIDHPALNFSRNPNEKVLAPLSDLISADSNGQLNLEIDGSALYMNKRFARRYQLAIFRADADVNPELGAGSLAARLVTVLPQIYTTQSGTSTSR